MAKTRSQFIHKNKKYKENKTHQNNKNFKNENEVFPPIQVFIFDFLLF
jgi:hypothetical protein